MGGELFQCSSLTLCFPKDGWLLALPVSKSVYFWKVIYGHDKFYGTVEISQEVDDSKLDQMRRLESFPNLFPSQFLGETQSIFFLLFSDTVHSVRVLRFLSIVMKTQIVCVCVCMCIKINLSSFFSQ